MKSHRKGGLENNNKGRSSSFHVRGEGVAAEMLLRPRTVPDLLHAGRRSVVEEIAKPQKLTKLLLHVTIPKSPVPVHVLLPPEATVEDLIAAALRQYVKEARRPFLPSADSSGFDLHYSQFNLESLVREETLMELGSRNFFLCPKSSKAEDTTSDDGAKAASSCSTEAVKNDLSWLRFMSLLQ